MSVFMDLNLSYTAEKGRLQSLIDTAAHLGFSTVAINYMFEPKAKKKQEIPAPTPINELIDQLPVVQGRSRPIRVLNRLTVVMSDSSHFAIDRGLVFEVSYSAAIRDATMRRYTIANAVSLMESCKGKNVILSSAAEQPLELRGPYDITNLGLLFGLSDGDAKEAVSSSCRSAVLHAETRKTASGIISTVKRGSEPSCQQEAPPAPDLSGDAPAAKRARPHLTQ
ncbi:ribonuclease P protein subunit p30 isoform X5 [Siniperca chuatsi]|uniref:ribonuclease P protein subunit p30 isoform X5 n=1 Tax=Siniperca chuatsi TaxID=119488 RepID=UPI001CE11C5C|nr:ribonuclease P protein subunit p30 isoform X5 [Siniperca chuatsi]